MIRRLFSKGPSGYSWHELITELDRLGFWDDIPVEERRAAIDEMIRKENFWIAETNRFQFGDSEDLAEGGIGEWLNELRPVFERYGASFGEVEDDLDDERYEISFEGNRIEVWGPGHIAAEERGDYNIWARGTYFAQTLANEVLERANTPVRVYMFSGGNDLQVCFMTPEMADTMINSGLLPKREQPYIMQSPTDT